MLEARACQTVAVEIERGWSLSDLDLRGGTNEDPPESFEREEGAIVGRRFDVIIAPDLLRRLDDPRPALQAMKEQLRPGGSLVIALTGITHVAGQLAIAGGRSLGAESCLLFTYDGLLGLLEEAKYIIGHVARFESTTNTPGADVGDGDGEDSSAAASVDRPVHHYLIVAHPSPIPGLDFLQRRTSNLVQREQSALRKVEDLFRNAELADQRLEILTGHEKRLEERIKDLRRKLLAAHAQLIQRDDEIRNTYGDIIGHRNALLIEREVLFREREELIRQSDTLRAERDFLRAECDSLAQSLRSAVARLNILRWSPPGLVYRMIRKLMSLRADRTGGRRTRNRGR
jgi:hypothetical protein